MPLQIVKTFLPQADIDRLDKIAKARGPQGGTSRSSIIREAVLFYLARESPDARARIAALRPDIPPSSYGCDRHG